MDGVALTEVCFARASLRGRAVNMHVLKMAAMLEVKLQRVSRQAKELSITMLLVIMPLVIMLTMEVILFISENFEATLALGMTF